MKGILRGVGLGGWALLLMSSSLMAQPQPFGYAGLSLSTTRADLMRRYPQEPLTGNYLSVAPERAHDHIHEIEIATPDGTGLGRLRLGFERPAVVGSDGQVRRPADYPRCANVEKQLRGLFGVPTLIDEFIEGDTDGYLVRVVSWERRLPHLTAAQQLERLSLQCGRSKSERQFQAHTVTIARSSR